LPLKSGETVRGDQAGAKLCDNDAGQEIRWPKDASNKKSDSARLAFCCILRSLDPRLEEFAGC